MGMLLKFYGLREQPFGVSPDPAYLYPSRTHREALDSLSEAIAADRGFLALIGEPGTGKTTLLHQAMEGLKDTARAIFLTQTQCSPREFFEYLMGELGVECGNLGLAGMHKKLNEVLFAEMMAGRRFVLIVDEAQNLEEPVLETIRMLSNYETPNYKLIQMILAGQPQLEEKLRRAELAQLAQRVTVLKRLEPLSGAESAAYVKHRLRVAGHATGELFERDALALVAERSRGIPREINKICYRALKEGFGAGCQAISGEIVERALAAEEFFAAGRRAPGITRTPTAPAMTSKPRVIGLRRRKLRSDFAWPASAVQLIWRSAVMSAMALASMALPYYGARRLSSPMLGEMALSKAGASSAPDAGGDGARSALSANAGGEPGKAAKAVTESPSATAIRIDTLVADARRFASDEQGRPVGGAERETAQTGPQSSLSRELGLNVRRIAIDPGHGGSDTGTKGPKGLMEKDLCLDVALRLGRLIEDSIPGAQVTYTRTDDRFVPLEVRTEIANEAKADLFISIHANSSESPEIRGVETYYMSLAGSREEGDIATRENAAAGYALHNLPELVKQITRTENLAESRELASDIQTALSRRLQLVSRGERNRGVKRAPFAVLIGANMPSVLSEISFLSNPSDEGLLVEREQRQRIAEGLYRGVEAYLAKTPGKVSMQGAPSKTEAREIGSSGVHLLPSDGRALADMPGGPGTQR